MPATSSTRRRSSVAAIAAITAVGLAACGDGDADSAATTAGTASAAAVTVDDGAAATSAPSTGEVPTDRDAYVTAAGAAMDTVDPDVAECLAGALVDTVGIGAIVEAGLTPTQFARASTLDEMGLSITAGQAEALATELPGCGDLVAAFVDDSFDEAQAACVREALSNEQTAELIVADLTGRPPSTEAIAATDAVTQCFAEATTPTT